MTKKEAMKLYYEKHKKEIIARQQAYYWKCKSEKEGFRRKENPLRKNFLYTVTTPEGKERHFQNVAQLAVFLGYCEDWTQRQLKDKEEINVLGCTITKKRR